MTTFEIIKNSESRSGWEISDEVYRGPIQDLVGGFNFEVADDSGNIEYMSAIYIHTTPEEYINNLFYDYFDTVKYKGYNPTGRVIFRGYGEEYYDPEYREWFVKPVTV